MKVLNSLFRYDGFTDEIAAKADQYCRGVFGDLDRVRGICIGWTIERQPAGRNCQSEGGKQWSR